MTVSDTIMEISSEEELKSVENYLKRLTKLKLYNIEHLGVRNKTILKNIILRSQNTHTVHAATGKYQCRPGANRSQGDLYRIMRYYSNDISLAEFRGLLFSFVNSNIISTLYCRDINKIVFRPQGYWGDDTDSGVAIYSTSLPPNWFSAGRNLVKSAFWGTLCRSFVLKDELGLNSQIE